MKHIILGTAGHIDHGKSSLVKALTGIDPDRLKEEKERGITIDIGFADLSFPEADLTVGIVDVPGHERLINNMLAGAGGIDMVLMVVAADEGIMPQSREHLAICNLLRIKSGIIALTKADLVEKDWLGLVTDELRNFVQGTFLEGCPIVPVSSRTGENLDALKSEIKTMAAGIEPKTSGGLFRLPIDRVFTLKGFGTVVTGTAVSGSLSVDDPVEILPSGIATKARGMQSHGKAITTAYAGQRVAVNLQGVEKEQLRRGDVAVVPGSFSPTRAIDVHVEMLRDVPLLKNRSQVHFYAGTSETIARVILYEKEELRPGESGYCQFRLQDPVVVMSGDRYIIRRFSPLETLGGGEVLDPLPARRRRKDGIQDLVSLHSGTMAERIALKIEKTGMRGLSAHALRGWISAETREIAAAVEELKKAKKIMAVDDLMIHQHSFEAMQAKIASVLDAFHKANPLKPGMPKEEVRAALNADGRVFNALIAASPNIAADKDLLRKKDFRIALSTNEEETRKKILGLLDSGGFQPPAKAEIMDGLKLDQKQMNDILNMLVKEKLIVRVNETFYLSASVHEKLLSILRAFFEKKPELTVAEFRDLINASRKYALPILEFLDASRVTIRTGDVRKLIGKK
ncbi:MAG: selenocysteine-specific translation elongation factor [Thermodesulfovibrionales bacterium]